MIDSLLGVAQAAQGFFEPDRRFLQMEWPLLRQGGCAQSDAQKRIMQGLCPFSLHWQEALNKGSSGRLRCFSVCAGLDAAALIRACIGQSLHVHYPAQEAERHHVALVAGAQFQGESQGLWWFELHLEDALTALGRGRSFRVFTERSTLGLTQDLHAVWCDANPAFSEVLALDASAVSGQHEEHVRAFVLQYDESDSVFLQRQWQAAGWHWHIESLLAPHGWMQVLKLSVDAGGWPSQGCSRYHRAHAAEAGDAVTSFQLMSTLGVDRVGLACADYKQPRWGRSAQGAQQGAQQGGQPPLSVRTESVDLRIGEGPLAGLLPRQQYVPGSHAGSGGGFVPSLDHAARQALSGSLLAQGHGTARHLAVGSCMDLQGWACVSGASSEAGLPGLGTDGLDLTEAVGGPSQWAVTDLSCEVNNLFADNIAGQGERPLYANRFSAVPPDHPLPVSPATLHTPLMQALTAVVTAPADQAACAGTVCTDSLGRVQVRFDFSALAGQDCQSAWLRVLQPSAGSGGGHLWLPRVGEEVLVQFLAGHPDRPVVTGALYSATHPPASLTGLSELPRDAALSGLRSQQWGEPDNSMAGSASPAQGSGLVFDNTPGAVGLVLGSDVDFSSLSLGSLTSMRRGGQASNRGRGFELCSQGGGVVRARQSLLLSTGGAAADAMALSAPAWLEDRAALQDEASGWTGIALDDLALPSGLASVAPAGAAFSMPSLVLHSAMDAHAHAHRCFVQTAGSTLSLQSGADFQCVSGAQMRLLARHGLCGHVGGGGAVWVAQAGDFSWKTMQGAFRVASSGPVLLTSSNAGIRLAAAQSIELQAGGARICLTDGQVQIHAPGGLDFRGTRKTMSGPVSHVSDLPHLDGQPDAHAPVRRLLRCVSMEGLPMPGNRIKIAPPLGDPMHGRALMGHGVWTSDCERLDDVGGEQDWEPGECPVES